MKRSNIKYSISRKPLRYLSVKQRRRLMNEVHSNIPVANRGSCVEANLESSINPIPSLSVPINTEADSFLPENPADYQETNVFSTYSFDSSDDSEFGAASIVESPFSLLFKDRLAACFVESNLNHTQKNSILSVLRFHSCFLNFPKDARTFIKTPRDRVNVISVEPGEYIHFDVEQQIVKFLKTVNPESYVNELNVDFSTDGCHLDKSGSIHLWPIQIRIANIQRAPPILVGIYKGNEKPFDTVKFFEHFIYDISNIISKGGINFNGNQLPLCLISFIADAPARAFVLNHHGRTSSKPCSKCKVIGTRVKKRYVFKNIKNVLRTDFDYLIRNDKDHHKEGTTPLMHIPIGLVSGVPFEYMHLVCSGVMKRLLLAWILGKFSPGSKISGNSVTVISNRLDIVKNYCPSDFARPPRRLELFAKYKATEFRQFLLYTGPIVLSGILEDSIYKHFLLLQAAIKVLVSPSCSLLWLRFAEIAIEKFVMRCEQLYGLYFNSYNVHGLLHITEDVRKFGSLDSFSAFPFENNNIIFRKLCRKPNLPLQQIVNRLKEIDNNAVSTIHDYASSVSKIVKCNATIHRPAYTKIKFKNTFLTTEIRNNCCLLFDGSVCIIETIDFKDDSYFLFVRKFETISDFYDVGIPSSDLQIFKCLNLHETVVPVK
ncbi:uncharacterized protein [Prorops nasuta]|uniref:uncharacterized protein n=1 Tax=Prorops nasuta TaxID=863751 RepID=UPI0034CFA4EB